MPAATPEALKVHHILFTGFGRLTRAQIERYAAAGACALIVGVNNEDDDAAGLGAVDLNDGFRWRHGQDGPEELRRNLDDAAQIGVKLIPMVWTRPARKYTEQSAEALEQFLAHPAFGGVCHDLERFWHKLQAPAKLSPDEAAALWLETWGRDNVKAYLTDYAGLPTQGAALLREALRAGVDAYGIPQAYSRHSWIPKDQMWRTPNTQKLARRTWGKVLSEAPPESRDIPRLICGLAAYDLGPRPNAWMRAQLAAAVDPEAPFPAQALDTFGAGAVAWWSTAAAGKAHLPGLLQLVTDTRAASFPAFLHPSYRPPQATTPRAPATTPRAEV